MQGIRIIQLFRPPRYVLVIFAFFLVFPFFMDLITPDVVYGYAGGTVDHEGNVVSSYEGGTAPQYQWYYPLLYPFMVVWYVGVLLFDVIDSVVPIAGTSYFVGRMVYFYFLAVTLGFGIEKLVARIHRFIH